MKYLICVFLILSACSPIKINHPITEITVIPSSLYDEPPKSICCNSNPVPAQMFDEWQGPDLFWVNAPTHKFMGCPLQHILHMPNDWSDFADSEIYNIPDINHILDNSKLLRCTPIRGIVFQTNYGFMNCVWSNSENKICPNSYFEYSKILD